MRGATRKNRERQQRESARRVASASGRAVAWSGEFRRGSGDGGRGVERRVDDRGGFRGSQGGCDVARRDLRVRSRARVGAKRRVGAAGIPRETARSSGRCERAPRHDDDLARVRWRERETRHASKGVARAANVPPDRRGAPGRVAILRATRRGARDRRGWSRASRAPHKRTAPRRGSRGARFRATRASPPRPVPRAKTSSCSRKGSSYVTRSVGRGARGIARGALRGSAAHAGPRSLSTAHQDARLGSREIFRSVVGPSSRFEPRRARTTHRPSNGPGVFLRGKRSRAVSRPVFFRHSQRHLVARAHLSIRNHPTPHARGLRQAKTPPESVRSVASKHPVHPTFARPGAAFAAVAQSASTSSSRTWAMNVLPFGSSGTGRATRTSRLAEM